MIANMCAAAFAAPAPDKTVHPSAATPAQKTKYAKSDIGLGLTLAQSNQLTPLISKELGKANEPVLDKKAPSDYAANWMKNGIRYDLQGFGKLSEMYISAPAVPQAEKHSIKTANTFIHVNVNVPVLSGLKDKKYEEQLNDILMRHALKEKAEVYASSKQAAQEAKKQKVSFNPAELHSGFRFVQSGNVVSLIVDTFKITNAEANGQSRTDCYVFINQDNAKALQLADLFKEDVDYKALLGNVVRNQIALKKNKDDFTFTEIKDTQSFYVSNGYLVLTFERYEIAPGAAGAPTFKLPLASIQSKLSDSFVQALQG
ncbi:hypothetical protein ABD76_23265 [Paenibacillus dendritiformis]|nr:hypothetical protein [Paenibacillus dendritiformis]